MSTYRMQATCMRFFIRGKRNSMNENQQNSTQARGVVLLMLTAIIWGLSFVAQSAGMDSIDAFTFSTFRSLIGAAVLVPVIYLQQRKKRGGDQKSESPVKVLNRKVVISGIVLGLIFCAASNFQQFAFYYTTSGKIAFITTLYIFFVPVITWITGKRIAPLTWLGVMLGFAGLYFLTINPNDLTGVNRGDILAVICAFLFSFHILYVEKVTRQVDGIVVSCIQFAIAGVISGVLMLIFETPVWSAIQSALVPLLYAGVMSCGVAYTLQIVGQKHTEATLASLIMSMESVFAVIAGGIILNEVLSGREILGCVIMFGAIILAQLSETITAKVGKHKLEPRMRSIQESNQ